MEDLTVYIYGLSDLSGNIRYIGQSVNPWLRYEQHIIDDAGTPKARWIQSMAVRGAKPNLVILDKTSKENARYLETWWIVMGRKKGWKLTNAVYPSMEIPTFEGMFAQHLKDDFEQFIIEHQPAFLVTKKQVEKATFYFRIFLGLIIGSFMAWNVYLFDVKLTNEPVIAFFYAFVVFVFTGYAGFFWAIDEFKRLGGVRLLIMCSSPLVLVALNLAIWVMGLGK